MQIKGTNIFENYLMLLGVRYTKSFSDQIFNEHPHKYNLYGLSKMLSDYGIENAAVRIAEKEQNIVAIETPFVAQFGGDFVAVYRVESENVRFVWKNKDHFLPLNKFIEAWTGIVLLAESSEKSGEPDYKVHRKTELFESAKKTSFVATMGMIVALAYIYNIRSIYNATNIAGYTSIILISLAGMYISWLLLLKQMRIQSQYADKICSLFKQKDCNSVLESESAKLFGIIGWSEIGFGYFLTNILLLLFHIPLWRGHGEALSVIALINILTLPFTFWSVWHQKTKAKQWCMLCLIVLALLWAIFTVNCLSGYINYQNFQSSILNPHFLFCVGCCYFVAISGTNLLVPKLNTEKTIQQLNQSINSIKADENVFATLLKQQPLYETDDCRSIIRFGNSDSKLQLTVLTNPYCNPCSKMHKRIEDLLHKTNNNISVQYILSSFNEELNPTNKFLIAACLENKTGSAMQIFSDWFEKGKLLRDDYFKNLSLNMDDPAIEIEFQKHDTWKQKSQLRSTPTVLINGYKLPDSYKVEDLRYFIDLDL